MTRTRIILPVLSSFLVLTVGCSDISDMTEGSDENMRDWFEWGTELKLPADAKFTAGRNNLILLSDIYLKLQVSPTYRKTLDDKLTRTIDAPSFDLPDDMKPWPPWDLNGKKLIFYKNQTGDVDTGGFISALAFEESTGIIYCHFVEYAP
ncbi:MAG: hypothetical protein QGG42_13890 [Phycisphaerae bacterium]|jgi:hypothetical protein|nr:hypothetical protein [Phycisphaerae bacterium]